MMPERQAEKARYDLMPDFYFDAVGTELGDPTAMTLVDLLGDVRGMRILDLACGHGRITRELARRGARVTGIDISVALLGRALSAEAQEPLRHHLREGHLTSDSTLAGERFGGVACNHGLADIDDLDGALGTVSRILAPGGRFALSIPHPCFPRWDETAPSSWPHAGGYHQ